MPEILARTFLPIEPVQGDEVARKEDTGAFLAAVQPTNRHSGMLWARPDTTVPPEFADLFVWSGTEWLPMGGGAVPPIPTGVVWDGNPSLVWDAATGGVTWSS